MKKSLVAGCIMYALAAPVWPQGYPTIDVAAIVQLKAQIDQMKAAYKQMEKDYESFNGSRGVANLLQRPDLRKHLPQDWQSVYDKVKSGDRSGVYGTINSAKDRNAVLSGQQIQGLASGTAGQLDRQRNSVAIAQGTAADSFKRASDRIDYLQSLANNIETSKDPKAVMDLQAGIAVEQAQLQNESIRMQLAQQLQAAEQRAALQREREELIQMTGPSRVRIK